MILERAYALVTIRENGREVKVPAIDAVILATIKSAVTGGQMAQKTFTEWIRGIEKRTAEIKEEVFQKLVKHKRRCIARRACQPHP